MPKYDLAHKQAIVALFNCQRKHYPYCDATFMCRSNSSLFLGRRGWGLAGGGTAAALKDFLELLAQGGAVLALAYGTTPLVLQAVILNVVVSHGSLRLCHLHQFRLAQLPSGLSCPLVLNDPLHGYFCGFCEN